MNPCLKCGTRPFIQTVSRKGKGLFVYAECLSCHRQGPVAHPLHNPEESLDATKVRAEHLWDRDTIPKSPGGPVADDSRYPGHVV